MYEVDFGSLLHTALGIPQTEYSDPGMISKMRILVVHDYTYLLPILPTAIMSAPQLRSYAYSSG
jgi:hypothetical protein